MGGTLSGVDLATQVTGTLPLANGGTGATTAIAAFDALAPTTTKGDLVVNDGSDNVRLAVGADNYVLTADSTQASGVKWAASNNISITFPFYKSAGTLDTIALIANSFLPFFNYAGTSKNIALTT